MLGMKRAIHNLAVRCHPARQSRFYYAFKQSETRVIQNVFTGWVQFLGGFFKPTSTYCTWPMRTEYTGNLKTKRNALAFSIVLVCRKRPADAPPSPRP